jgi:hypothetical protein
MASTTAASRSYSDTSSYTLSRAVSTALPAVSPPPLLQEWRGYGATHSGALAGSPEQAVGKWTFDNLACNPSRPPHPPPVPRAFPAGPKPSAPLPRTHPRSARSFSLTNSS